MIERKNCQERETVLRESIVHKWEQLTAERQEELISYVDVLLEARLAPQSVQDRPHLKD